MTDINTEIIIKEKRKNKLGAGRPKIYADGCKNNEKLVKYHQEYYHKTNKEIICEFCGKKSTTRTLATHQSSMKCNFIRIKNEMQNENQNIM
jgi:hypothetical protein